MRRISCYLPLLFVLLCSIQLASAQSAFDLNIGGGYFHDKAAAGTDTTTGLNCTSTTAASNCLATSSLGGFFLGFGGDLMLHKKFGVGAEYVATPAKADYQSPVQYRQHFWDFNAIYAPISEKKVTLQLMGGIGESQTGVSESVTSCAVGNSFCSTQPVTAPAANHFQVHAGVGVQIFLTDHIYIRPQFDLHYVPNFVEFGSSIVPGGMVWVGYSFGDR